MKTCHVLPLGLTPYQQAWDMQAEIAAEVAAGTRPPTLLLLEHPRVYTFGRRGHPENLLWDEAERARRGIEVHSVDRGGDVTYHGPGQLVGYPIIPLVPVGAGSPRPRLAFANAGAGEPRPYAPPSPPAGRGPGGGVGEVRANYTGYVRNLEKALIKTIAGFGIVSGQIPGLTGVWVQPDVASRCRHCPPAAKKQPSKIAAIGVKVDVKGITRHGFALNVNTDMEYWDGIIGCGLDAPVINLADLLDEPPDMQDVMDKFVASFGQVFGCEMIPAGIQVQ